MAHAFADLANSHYPEAVEAFVAEGYVNHNPFVADGREPTGRFGRDGSPRSPTPRSLSKTCWLKRDGPQGPLYQGARNFCAGRDRNDAAGGTIQDIFAHAWATWDRRSLSGRQRT